MVPTDADVPTLAADDPVGDPAGDPVGEGDSGSPDGESTLGSEHGPGGGAARVVELPEVDRERYVVGEHVASGGGGRIHVAHDGWLGRTVAIKRLRPTGDRTAQERFAREALLTARLQHPGIVPVYEAGRWPGGDPFYAMKLVSGQPLSTPIAAARSLAERLALLPHVLDVAEAIAYAHSRGVIHRDLKPANVLVGKFGETVVIDWGLGKDLGDDAPSEQVETAAVELQGEPVEGALEPDDDELTRAGAVMGTPAYMPPEQARGEAVGPAADVYALGAILYHVLSGRSPYERGTGLEVLGRVLLGPPPPLTELVPRVPRELAAIVRKAMAREPDDRYPTAAQLAEDLRRYQTGQIVGAHRYTTRQRLRRWLWRHRTAVSATAAALVVLAVAGGYAHLELRAEHGRTLREYERAEGERANAMEALARAEAAKAQADASMAQALDRADALLLERARVETPRKPNAALGCLSQLSDRFEGWRQAQVIAADAAARGLASVLGPCRDGDREQGEAVGRTCVPGGVMGLMAGPGRVDVLRGDGRIEGFEPLEPRSLGEVVPARGVRRAARRGDVLVTVDDAGELRRWDVPSKTSEVLGRFEHAPSWVRLAGAHGVLALEPSVSASTLWHWAPDRPLRALTTCLRIGDQLAPAVASSPAGGWAGCMGHGEIVLAELEGDRTLRIPVDSMIRDVAVSDDGRWVAWAGKDGTLPTIWDVAGRRRLHPTLDGDGIQISRLAFVPGSSRLVALSYGGAVASWEPGQAELRRLSTHGAAVYSMAVSDDGRRLATSAGDGTVHLHDLREGSVRRLEGFTGAGLEVVLLPEDGPVVVTALDERAYAWPVTSAHGEVLARLPEGSTGLAVDAAGTRALVGGREGSLWLLPLRDGAEPQRLEGLRGEVTALSFTPDGTGVVAGSDGGTVGLWSVEGERRWLEGLDVGRIRGLSLSADGAELAVAGYHHGAVRLATATGQRHATIPGQRAAGVTLLPDDGLLLWSHEGWVGLWGRDGHERLRQQLSDEVWVARISPRGDALVVAGRDGRLRRYALPDGSERQPALEGRLDVVDIAYVDGGRRLLTIGNDLRMRLWDAETLALVRSFEGHRGHLTQVAVREGGARVVTGSHDGTARLWDLATGESRELVGHTGAVWAPVLLPDGRAVLTAGADGTVRRWPDDVPHDEAGLRRWLDEQLARVP